MSTRSHKPETPEVDVDEPGLDPARVPVGSMRHRLRSNPVTRQPYRVGVFVLGLLLICTGIALAVLPGPLTIPPVLLGLWIWSWEFRFAQKFFESFQEKAHEALDAAKEKPVVAAVGTITGLAMAVVGTWAVIHYDLVAKGKDAIGL